MELGSSITQGLTLIIGFVVLLAIMVVFMAFLVFIALTIIQELRYLLTYSHKFESYLVEALIVYLGLFALYLTYNSLSFDNKFSLTEQLDQFMQFIYFLFSWILGVIFLFALVVLCIFGYRIIFHKRKFYSLDFFINVFFIPILVYFGYKYFEGTIPTKQQIYGSLLTKIDFYITNFFLEMVIFLVGGIFLLILVVIVLFYHKFSNTKPKYSAGELENVKTELTQVIEITKGLEIIFKSQYKLENLSFSTGINLAHENGLIDDIEYKTLNTFRQMRNQLIHGDIEAEKDNLVGNIDQAEKILLRLNKQHANLS